MARILGIQKFLYFCKNSIKNNNYSTYLNLITFKKVIFAKKHPMKTLQSTIENAWNNRELLKEETTLNAINQVIALLDEGTLRVAEPIENGWQGNPPVKISCDGKSSTLTSCRFLSVSSCSKFSS
jgi:hypothetical protein